MVRDRLVDLSRICRFIVKKNQRAVDLKTASTPDSQSETVFTIARRRRLIAVGLWPRTIRLRR